MTERPGLGDLLPPWLRSLPADLAAMVAMVVLVNLAVFLPVVGETPLRVVLGLPFVLFVPGYLFIAALFPEAGSSPTEDEDPEAERSGIDGIERVALSFGLSIAIVPLIGLILNFTPWGIRLVPIMVSLSLFSLLAAAVAAQRRRDLPPDERLVIPWRTWLQRGREELFEPETRADALLNVLLVVSILLAVASVGYAVMVPKQGESFTELFVLTYDEEGELIAAGYPTDFVRGESKPVVLGVGNQEHQEMTYEIVVEIQDVRFQNNSTTVLAQDELGRLQTGSIGHNETWLRNYSITPTMTGQDLRVIFLLYRGEAPAEANSSSAYREIHLFINVSAPTAERVERLDVCRAG